MIETSAHLPVYLAAAAAATTAMAQKAPFAVDRNISYFFGYIDPISIYFCFPDFFSVPYPHSTTKAIAQRVVFNAHCIASRDLVMMSVKSLPCSAVALKIEISYKER